MNITRPATGLGWLLAIIVLIIAVLLMVFPGGPGFSLQLALLAALALALVIG